LDAFFRIHNYLVEHAKMPIRRQLMDEIDWNDRLIAIKGGRGVGKTDFLLSRAKEIEIEEKKKAEEEALVATKRRRSKSPLRPCLYVSMNDFFFTKHSLMELAS
jgi:predicted AAA+ superfamily ATPase